VPDDTFDLDGFEDDADETPEASNESDPFKKLRAHSRKLERQLRENKKELEELRSFRVNRETELRNSTVAETLKSLGLSENHAELFNAVNKDAEPTEANIKAFAEKYGLASAPAGDGSTEEAGGFAPTPPAGSPAAPKRLSSAEWHSLYKENPEAAFKALRESRVDLQTTL
jgi:hypothetical protein